MKKKLSLTVLLSGCLPMMVFAGGIKGDIISNELLVLFVVVVLFMLIGSMITSIAYHRTYRPEYLIISSLLTLPFFLAGVYLIALIDNFPLIPVLCFVPVLVNTILFITAKPKTLDKA